MPKIGKIQVEFEGRWREEEVIIEDDPLSPWTQDAGHAVVGKPTPRIDGPERVSGKAIYTHDVRLPGMLHGKILRCPHPHARIVDIDASEAEAMDGVLGVMTYKNAPEIPYHGGVSRLLDNLCLYRGEEVAAVVALDEYIAADALQRIRVEYEELPFVTDHQQALEEGAPEARPGGNEFFEPARDVYDRGDVEAGLKDADVVVEATFHTQVAMHNCMETHGSVAHWEGNHLTVWDSTQTVFHVRRDLAEALQMPLHRVRVIKHYMGGGFGSKASAGKYSLLAALFSRMVGRPVRFILSREEENLATGNRPAEILECRAGAKQDGTLTALVLRWHSAMGAYGNAADPCGGPFREMYKCPNVHTEQRVVYTNSGPACAFRAPGYVEGSFALEGLMDELAGKLGMDPLALRLANYAEDNQVRKQPYSSKALRAAYDMGAEKIGWANRETAKPADGGRFRRGFGMASHIWGGSGAPPSYAVVKVNADATIDVITGTQDIGTGAKTAFAQIAAEELGVRLEDVSVSLGDTQLGIYSVVSGGSQTVSSVGPAVRIAANDAKKQLLDLAAYMLDTPAEKLDIRDRTVVVADDPSKTLPLSKVAGKMGNYTIIGKGGRAPNPTDSTVNTFGAQFAEVEVDTETGKVRVLRVVGGHDVGLVINPMGAISQCDGGVIQATGYAISEGRIIDGPTGYVVNPNMLDYKMLTMLDIPAIDVQPVKTADPVSNNLGSKGLGEPPIIPTAAAIANAVYDAIGVRIRTLPLTPKTILEALQAEEVDA